MQKCIDFLLVLFATLRYDVVRVFARCCSQTELSRNGILVQLSFLSNSSVKELLNALDELVLKLKAEGEGEFARGVHGYDTGMLDIKNVDSYIPKLNEMIGADEVCRKLAELVGKPVALKNINCYVNEGITDTRVFHADSHANSQYKAFIYLTDVLSDDDGPYTYILGSHKPLFKRYVNICMNFFSGRALTDYHRFHSASQIFKAKAEKGSLVISDQNGAHRGWPQSHKSRRVLISVNFV